MFKPGFRISTLDITVIVAALLAAYWLAAEFTQLSTGILFVVAHFFLFCNVVRMSRIPELIWASHFVLLSIASIHYDYIAWHYTLLLSVVVTILLIALETRRSGYHGVFWKTLNPNLPQWYEKHHSASINAENQNEL